MRIITIIHLLLIMTSGTAQPLNLAEKLGYPSDAKLLIIHADDAGVSHSTNQAVMEAFQAGNINSTAIMVPCPWFPEIANFFTENPNYDYGLHLTFSSEWHTYKWCGTAASSNISSLLDGNGYFYPSTELAVKNAKLTEIETELRGQIEKALSAGLKPSHFDSHMLTLWGNPDIFRLYLKLGVEYKVPVLLPKNYFTGRDSFFIEELKHHILIDNAIEATTSTAPENWALNYTHALDSLQPGVYQLVLHLAYDDDETRAMTKDHEYFDAAWRQRDVDYISSKPFKNALRRNNIQLITWQQIQKIMYPD